MDKHSRCCTGRWLLEATIQLCVDGAITGEAAPWPSRGQVRLQWVPSVVSSAWSVMSRGKAALVRPGLREQSSQPGGNLDTSLPIPAQEGREGRQEGRKVGRQRPPSPRPLSGRRGQWRCHEGQWGNAWGPGSAPPAAG